MVCNFLLAGKTEFDNHNIRPFDFGRWLPALHAAVVHRQRLLGPEGGHDWAVAAGVDSTFMPGRIRLWRLQAPSAEPIAEGSQHVRQVVAKG